MNQHPRSSSSHLVASLVVVGLGLVAACGPASPAEGAATSDVTGANEATGSQALVVDHDTIQGFAESASATELAFKPTLKVFAGCVPHVAVDQWGNTSGGLQASGGASSGCSKSVGQVYSRMAHYYGMCAVMYSWYFPKDKWISGHRHDWENIVVWLSDCKPDAQVVSVSYSGHGQYTKDTSPPLDGTHPKVRYASNGIMNHQLWATDEMGGTQPLVSWESLTQAARDALSTTDFGSANVPFKAGGDYWRNLQLAH